MTQQELTQELQKIEELLKTPVKERPRYKAFYEEIKKIAEAEGATEYEPKWMREAYVWMANRKTFQNLQQEESEWYLRAAQIRTKDLFRRYKSSL